MDVNNILFVNSIVIVTSLLPTFGSDNYRPIEHLGTQLDLQTPLIHDDLNLVNQVILINPSQQVQSDDLLITKLNIEWGPVDTAVRIQLWRQVSSSDLGSFAGYFSLQQQTHILRSNRTGRVSFSCAMYGGHGDVLGIYLLTHNPIPYRHRLGECQHPNTRVWTLVKQTEPLIWNTLLFEAAQVGDMCRDYLIEAEYKLIKYSTVERLLLGSRPVERPTLGPDRYEIIIPAPHHTLPFDARVLGWKAYINVPLKTVRFMVLTPAGSDRMYYTSYVSNNYQVFHIGEFYARINYILIRVVPQGSVVGLLHSEENPIPYTEHTNCREESTVLYTSIPNYGMTSYPSKSLLGRTLSFTTKTAAPCREYSVQLVYDDNGAPYPEDCITLDVTLTQKEATSGSYNVQGGIVTDSTKECWVLRAPKDSFIELKLQDLHLTQDFSCPESNSNALYIRDGDSLEGPTLETFCPGEVNRTLTTCSDVLHLYLKTTDSNSKKGVKFSYRTLKYAPSQCKVPVGRSVSMGTSQSSHTSSLCLLLVILVSMAYSLSFNTLCIFTRCLCAHWEPEKTL